jgi:thioredoxin reductase (NADPH)
VDREGVVNVVSCDVVVVGGATAGLSGAIALARSLRRVVVVDGGEPRNAPAAHAHNVLGREGVRPLDLLAAGRAEALGYGVEFVEDRAVLARRDGAEIVVETLQGNEVRARRLLLATGLVDELPDVPGVGEFWGGSVLHCPFCHGYEVRGRRIGILGSRPSALHQALMFRQLSPDVTLFAQDLEIPEENSAQFAALGIAVERGTVRSVSGTEGDLTLDVDGTPFGVEALVVTPYFRARADLFAQLGGELAQNPMGEFVPTTFGGATDVPGVWAAGNVADLSAMVQGSSGAGVMAGAHINGDLIASDARAAVEAVRVVD